MTIYLTNLQGQLLIASESNLNVALIETFVHIMAQIFCSTRRLVEDFVLDV